MLIKAGKGNLDRVSGEFELSEFEYKRGEIQGNIGLSSS